MQSGEGSPERGTRSSKGNAVAVVSVSRRGGSRRSGG